MGLPPELQEAFDETVAALAEEGRESTILEQRAAIAKNCVLDRVAAQHRLAELLEVAQTQVPFYTDTAADAAPLPFAELPLVSKQTMRTRFADFIARSPDDGAVPPGTLYLLRTSGSTGEPVSSLKTAEGDGFADAVIMERLYRDIGVPETGIALHLPLLNRDAPLLEPILLPRPYIAWNLRGYSPESPLVVEEYNAIVGHQEIDLIYGTSSRIISLAWYCRANAITLRPAGVIATYEHMAESGRTLVEETFGTSVTMLYGTAETGLSGWECPLRRMHMQDDWVGTEVLDDRGAPVPDDDTPGNLVLTSLKSSVMPVLRYVTGDIAPRPLPECECGRPGTVLPRLIGRANSRLVGIDGAAYSPYPLLGALSAAGLPDYQLIQETPGTLTMVASSQGPDPEPVVTAINAELRAYFGEDNGFTLVLGARDSFQLTTSGKRNPLLQRLDVPIGPERTGYLHP